MVSPRRLAGLHLLMAMVLLPGLTACETFDPAGWVTGPVEAPERITVEGLDPDAPFPTLARVPSAPPRPTSKRDRLGLAQDLAVQRSKARYTTGAPQPGAPQPGAPQPDAPQPGAPQPGAPQPDASNRPVTQPAPSGTSQSFQGVSPSLRPTAPGPAPLPPLSAAAPVAETEPENLVRTTPPAARVAPAADRPVGQLVAVFYFPGGASDLNPEDRDLIEEVALLHRQNGGRLRVVGHAAPRVRSAGPGTWGLARLRLSLNRASKVARRLAALGSATEDLVVAAASDLDRSRDLLAGPGDARHHRVEIFLEE